MDRSECQTCGAPCTGETVPRGPHNSEYVLTYAPLPPAEQASGESWPDGVLNREKTLEVLTHHNAWRRGASTEQTDPRMLGLALEAAIAFIAPQQPTGEEG